MRGTWNYCFWLYLQPYIRVTLTFVIRQGTNLHFPLPRWRSVRCTPHQQQTLGRWTWCNTSPLIKVSSAVKLSLELWPYQPSPVLIHLQPETLSQIGIMRDTFLTIPLPNPISQDWIYFLILVLLFSWVLPCLDRKSSSHLFRGWRWTWE